MGYFWKRSAMRLILRVVGSLVSAGRSIRSVPTLLTFASQKSFPRKVISDWHRSREFISISHLVSKPCIDKKNVSMLMLSKLTGFLMVPSFVCFHLHPTLQASFANSEAAVYFGVRFSVSPQAGHTVGANSVQSKPKCNF